MMLRMVMGLGALALLSGTASAADSDSRFRFGVGGGQVTIEADDADLEGDAFGWEIFAGYEFSPYLAIEVGYLDGGTADDTIAEGITVEADTNAIVASLVGSIPIGESFSLFGRAGYMHWESEQSLRVEGETALSGDFDGNDPFFGAGVAATLDGALVRLEYRMASLDDSDLSMIGASIVWRF